MSAAITGQKAEYAIEVPDKGYLDYSNNLTTRLGDIATYGSSTDLRLCSVLQSVRKRYYDMGAGEIGNTLRIVRRVVTVQCDDWAPIDPSHEFFLAATADRR